MHGKRLSLLIGTFLLALAIVVPLVACGGGTPTTPTNTPGATATQTGVKHYLCIWSTNDSSTSDNTRNTLETFAKINEDLKPYNIQIDLEPHYGWEIFPGTQSIEAVSRNTIQMGKTGSYSEEDFEPRFAINSLPALFSGYDHAMRFAQTPEWQALEADVEKKGTKIVAETYYDMYLGFKPKVYTLEDIKGLRVRTMESATMQQAMTYLGLKPIIVNQTELTFAMQTGMIDGLIYARGISWFKMLRYHEFMTESVHFPFSTVPNYQAVSTTWFYSLPKVAQDAILKEMKEYYMVRSRDITDKANAEALDLMNSVGIEQYDLPTAEYDRWIAAIQPAYASVRAKAGCAVLLDAALRTLHQ